MAENTFGRDVFTYVNDFRDLELSEADKKRFLVTIQSINDSMVDNRMFFLRQDVAAMVSYNSKFLT